MEVKAALIPFQTDEADDLAAPAFLVFDQCLVGHIQKHFRRQHRAPVSHESIVFPVIERQVVQIVCVSVLVIKALEVNRQAGINRVALRMNDARLWKYRMNQPQMQKVVRHLVHYAQGGGGVALQLGFALARMP